MCIVEKDIQLNEEEKEVLKEMLIEKQRVKEENDAEKQRIKQEKDAKPKAKRTLKK